MQLLQASFPPTLLNFSRKLEGEKLQVLVGAICSQGVRKERIESCVWDCACDTIDLLI